MFGAATLRNDLQALDDWTARSFDEIDGSGTPEEPRRGAASIQRYRIPGKPRIVESDRRKTFKGDRTQQLDVGAKRRDRVARVNHRHAF